MSADASSVVVAGSFTVDPVADSLGLLLREAGLDLPVTIAPYGQIFQELLDPGSAFARNRDGVNVVLVRFEDWSRDVGAAPGHVDRARSQRNVDDLVKAIRGAAESRAVPLLVSVCPPSAAAQANVETRELLTYLTTQLQGGIAGAPGVRFIESAKATDKLSGVELFDAEGDRLGHVPYTPLYFAALGSVLAREIHVLKRPPHKVLVLDCDNTLWKGVVGEDGVSGIELTPPHLALQRFAVAKKNAGMVVCLASKNIESDVLEVFSGRPEMVLKAEDIVSMRVDWQPKSQNLHTLAAELNLGLDSFVFVDDNPVECAEVEASCPGVLALRLPLDDDFPAFLEGVWPLDQGSVTEEDRRRTEMYRENLARDRYQKSAGDLGAFLAGLELRIDIAEPGPESLPRFAQLTQRTNQFNISTRRRTEADVSRLASEGKGHRAITVRDRFGDYGLVGATIFGKQGDALVVDTLLLSCRVLGRGVEHAMMRDLAAAAQAQGLRRVIAPFIPTKKNQPAQRFLDGLQVENKETDTDGTVRYVFATDYLAGLSYIAGSDAADLAALEADGKKATKTGEAPPDAESKSTRWNRIARELRTPQQILAAIERAAVRDRILPTRATGLVAPRTDVERALAGIWQQVLRLRQLGVRDDYFEIGGTSLQAVTVFARIERELGARLPLSALTEHPTIEKLAVLLEKPLDVQPLVLLNASESHAAPLFLVHDADGETLLYRNLAQRLAGERAVYGIQPQGRGDTAITCTRIEDMAALYVAEIRRTRPHGPYLLGGLCAGGVVAFEMARQLEAARETAHLVAVFDAADVEAQPRPYLRAGRSVGRLREALSSASILKLPKVVIDKAWGFVSYEVESRARKATRRLSVATLRLCLDRGLPLPPWARRLPIRDVYTFAESQYRPHHTVREEIVLYRATTGDGPDEPYTQLYVDPLLGWGPRSATGVRAYDVPGGHGSMLQEPHVATVAAKISNYLRDGVERHQPVLAAGE